VIQKTLPVDVNDYDNLNNIEELPNFAIGFPKLIFPEKMGKKGKEFIVPFIVQNFLDKEILIKLNRIEDNRKTILTKKSQELSVSPLSRSELNIPIVVRITLHTGSAIWQ